MPRIAARINALFPTGRTCAVVGASTLALGGAPAGAGAASGPPALDRAEQAVVAKINSERSMRGLRQLRTDDQLARAADAHSADMLARGYFAHDTPGGPSWSARIARYVRARALGEVIAKLWRSGSAGAPGPRTEASRVVRMWMNSPSHRNILLSRGLRRLGVAQRGGRSQGGVATLYTADFAGGR